MASNPDITLVGLDASTDVTGVAIVSFNAKGRPVYAYATAFNAKAECKPAAKDAMRARLDRIRATRYWINEQMSMSSIIGPRALDAVAFERPFLRGEAANSALLMAAGNYLTIGYFSGLPVYPISTQTVKGVCGLGGMRSKTTTAKERSERREKEKQHGILWANVFFAEVAGYARLEPTEDAKADALIVAVAAWRAIKKAEATA